MTENQHTDAAALAKARDAMAAGYQANTDRGNPRRENAYLRQSAAQQNPQQLAAYRAAVQRGAPLSPAQRMTMGYLAEAEAAAQELRRRGEDA